MYCLFCFVPCIVYLYMCTELLPLGGYAIAVKYIISYIFLSFVLFYVFLCCSMYCLFCVFLFIVYLYMCTELLPLGGYAIAVKYIIPYIFFKLYSNIEVYIFISLTPKYFPQ